MFVSLTGLGMSKSTVHRLLASMCARHYVEKNENHTYSIGCDVIYLEKLDIYPNTMLYTQVGFRSPAYCSSMGKCLLSCLSGDELEDALYGCTFKKYTPNTITDIREFKKYLRSVRCQGWAMDDEEYPLGHRCIGAPVYDYRGTPVAAISASGSVRQLPDNILDSVIREVKQAASDLSRKMGYIG